MMRINLMKAPNFKPLAEARESNIAQVVRNLFSAERAGSILHMVDEIDFLEELRVRRGQAIIGRRWDREYIVEPIVAKDEMEDILERVNKSSLYAWEEEYRRGFITLAGGHRVGLAGKAMLNRGEVRALKDINALNIRFARNVYGVERALMPYIRTVNGVENTLILGAPGVGKTTVLREVIRNLSDGDEINRAYQVAVVDERSELAGMYEGECNLNIGKRSDILDGCPKSQGIQMLIRSMAPEVLAMDELGALEDIVALEEALACGIAVIATMHGKSLADIANRVEMERILDKHLFQTIIILSKNQGVGRIGEIYKWQNESYERVR